MAKYGSQSEFRERSWKAVKDAALVAYGIELSDTYCLMVATGKMRFKEAVRAFKCEEQGTNKPVH